jgi:hypothetical protein
VQVAGVPCDRSDRTRPRGVETSRAVGGKCRLLSPRPGPGRQRAARQPALLSFSGGRFRPEAAIGALGG